MKVDNERIRAVLDITRGPRVLHVGCCGHRFPATGEELAHWLHAALVEAGHSVLGGDIDTVELGRMTQAGYDVAYLDAQAMPDGEKFDSIVAGELIEHLENPGLFLDGCLRRLAPGGRLILTTPNVFSVMDILHYVRRFDQGFNPEHTCWFDAQTIRQLLERCGFHVVALDFVDDLRPEVAQSRLYSLFSSIWRVARLVLPARYRNTLVIHAEPAMGSGRT